MPLTRAAAVPCQTPVAAAAADLRAPDADTRRRVALALGGNATAETLAALVAQLQVETDDSVREALFTACGMIGGTEAASALVPFLRLEDAGLRNGALETLQHLGAAAADAVDDALNDKDKDVRQLAVDVMRAWPPEHIVPRLRRLLANEPNVNVMGAVIDLAAQRGDASLLPDLARCRARFAGDGFIGFAIDIAQEALAVPKKTRRARKTAP
jgi:HEAT repeat protein